MRPRQINKCNGYCNMRPRQINKCNGYCNMRPRQINKCNGCCNMRPIFSLLNSNIENVIPFRTLSIKNRITTFIVEQQVKKTPAVGLTCLKCLSV